MIVFFLVVPYIGRLCFCKINQRCMLMFAIYLVYIRKLWRIKKLCPGRPHAELWAAYFYPQSGFFLYFPHQSLIRVFVQFYMTANSKPLIQLLVVHQQHFAFMDNIHRDDKINKLMNVTHGYQQFNLPIRFFKHSLKYFIMEKSEKILRMLTKI